MYENDNNPIFRKWKSVGGQAVAGSSINSLQNILDKTATYEPFTNGVILNSPVFGAVYVARSIFNKYQLLGTDLQMSLGNAVGDSFAAPNGAQAAYFERGMIVAVSNNQAFAIHRFIYARYRKEGDVNGPLGLPVSDEKNGEKGGKISHFENGDICWHKDTGACVILGDIRDHWLSLGGSSGFLGYPLTDEQPVIEDGVEIGRSTRFEGGAIFWKPDRGAFEVHGEIYQAWELKNGGATGDLGFPVSDVKKTPTSGGLYSNFEHGVIVWHPPGLFPKTAAQFNTKTFKTMELFAQRMIGTGGDGPGDSNLEMFMFHKVEVQNRAEAPVNQVISKGRKPSGSKIWKQSEVTLSMRFPITDCVQGDMKLIVRFTGFDNDTFSSNDRLGTINHGDVEAEALLPAYSVDNLWGTEDLIRKDNDAFHMDYIIGEKSQAFDPNKQFREQWMWKFHNFTTEKLDLDAYNNTFTDVDSQGIQLINPLTYLDEGWEALFYHLAFKGVAKGGNCFGMSLEAIYAMAQRSLFNEPIFRWGNPNATDNKPNETDDRELMHEINMKQGYQLGAYYIYWYIEQLFNGMTHNPQAVFEDSRAAYLRGDYPMLSLKTFTGGTGHAVLPINWVSDKDPWEIWLADSNFPAVSGDIQDSAHKILIFSDNHFEYEDYDGGTWIGSRLSYTPFSVLSRDPETPGLGLLELIVGGTIFLMGDSGETRQITDDLNRTFYDPNLKGTPTRLDQMQADASKRIPGLARIPLMGGEQDNVSLPELYYSKGGSGALHFQTRSKNNSPTYQCAIQSPTLSAIVKVSAESGKAGSGMETFTIKRQKSNSVLSITPNDSAKSFEIRLEQRGGQKAAAARVFVIRNLRLENNQKIDLKLSDAGNTLHINNFGAKLAFKLAVGNLVEREIVVEKEQSLRLSPQWQKPDSQWQVVPDTPSLRYYLESKGSDPKSGIKLINSSDINLRNLL